MKKITYKQRLFSYFFLIFVLFAVGIVALEQGHERNLKTEALEEKLDAYANMIDAALRKYQLESHVMDTLLEVLPNNIRLTLIEKNGAVLYDNMIKEIGQLENHAHRPEVVKAQKEGRGSDIRLSASNQKEYLYYAKRFPNHYIRVALPYDIQLKHFLKTDNYFLYYIFVVFAAVLLLINYVANRFGKSIKQLSDFTHLAENDETLTFSLDFPDDELGAMGVKISENYRKLKEKEIELTHEREKLLQHVYNSEEGLCFFTADKKVEFYNGLFIQYLNVISDDVDGTPEKLFADADFAQINVFLSRHKKDENYFETQINKHGKNFALRVTIFENQSFEIVINDITGHEKTRVLKQEMTGNIAHELRTPVTSIRGYLETVLEQKMSAEKQHEFLAKAYNQTLILSELIQDMSLITKMEEASQTFEMEPVSILKTLEKVKSDLEKNLQDKGIDMQWNIDDTVLVNGNPNLLYSIFRNLTDNAVRYAGSNIKIFVSKYNEDKDFYYFSYSDNGVGIANEQHLHRLFERFYRIDSGRTRDTGGSGLGLSIVKNAIIFHKGTIVAKNRAEGGLEFLFQLPKAR